MKIKTFEQLNYVSEPFDPDEKIEYDVNIFEVLVIYNFLI